MRHHLQRSLRAFVFILAFHGVTLAQNDGSIAGQWTVGVPFGDHVLLSIQRINGNSRMSHSSPVDLSLFRGLSRSQFDSSGSLVRFELVRDAGTMRFEGYVQRDGGGGTFAFVPSPNFANQMGALGYSGLTEESAFVCAVYDVGLVFSREIQRTGLQGLTLENLIRLRGQGISPDYVRAAQKRFKDISINDLIRLKGAGIL
jgi:hypothetical protein